MAIAKQALINHVVVLIDASGSMQGREQDVVRVMDSQVAYLAKRSKDLDQETRLTVYLFDNQMRNLFYDIDVLRMPTLKGLYRPSGGTALMDSTFRAIEEMQETATRYGDHAFLMFVLTDGEENGSRHISSAQLAARITGLRDNWTVACLVPNIKCRQDAQRFGFPAGNIAIWEVQNIDGLDEVGETMKTALDSYTAGRATGTRSTNTLFVNSGNITQQAIAQTGLKALKPTDFMLIPVANDGTLTVIRSGKKTLKHPDGIACLEIADFVRSTGRPYVVGRAFYQLTKSERCDPNKRIAVVNTKTKEVFVGHEARQLIGLPMTATRVRPVPKIKGQPEPDFWVFVESQSVNRHLVIGTQLLLLNQ